MIKIFYPYWAKASRWEELKYSLRSLEKNFKQDFEVWIVGDLPEWVKANCANLDELSEKSCELQVAGCGLVHIPYERDDSKNSLWNTTRMMEVFIEESSECLKFGVPKIVCDSRVTPKSPEGDFKPTNQNNERETRTAFVLRKEFPFLSADDCPEEFKILVNDMINSHERYVKGHPNLFAVANKGNEACFEAGKLVVENYLNNRKCWEELEHYKKTGQILGDHPLFAKRKRETELKNMPVTELSALYRNLPRNIRYYGKLIEDDADNELTGERLEKKKWFEWELAIVKRLLEVRERRSTSSRNGGAQKKKVNSGNGKAQKKKNLKI